jgi:hypothetical protein
MTMIRTLFAGTRTVALGVFLSLVAASGPRAHAGSWDCCPPGSELGCGWAECAMFVCTFYPYCCDEVWDEFCAQAAEGFCGELPRACCLPTGCVVLTPDECNAMEGTPDCGPTCAGVVCPTGACCLPGGCSAGSTPGACAAAGGSYLGDDSTCEGGPCPGACCLDCGACTASSQGACASMGGSFQGIGSVCSAGGCGPACPGACCFDDAPCQVLLEDACVALGGTFTDDETCEESMCDSDGDSLPDRWETQGVDINDDGTIDLDLPALGADWMRKDLFVEVDAMSGAAPNPQALDMVVQAFADSPVGNPEGGDGVTLHIQIDEDDLPVFDPWNTGGGHFPVDFSTQKGLYFGTPVQRVNPNNEQIIAAKLRVYRYCIYGLAFDDSTIGTAEDAPSNNFALAKTEINRFAQGHCAGCLDIEAAAFMHEFGHCLGLLHGGHEIRTGKPNYISVMNYLRTYPYYPEAKSRSLWKLDYSSGTRLPLFEQILNEREGIIDTASENLLTYYGVSPCFLDECTTIVHEPWQSGVFVSAEFGTLGGDFNGDSQYDVEVCADITYHGASAPIGLNFVTPCDSLTDHDDWSNLTYALVDEGAGPMGGGPPEEPTVDELLALAANLPAPCEGDMNFDDVVDFRDVLSVIMTWGPCEGCTNDWDGNGAVGGMELMLVISAWGTCR